MERTKASRTFEYTRFFDIAFGGTDGVGCFVARRLVGAHGGWSARASAHGKTKSPPARVTKRARAANRGRL